jgi:hypothetical protein
MALIAVALCLLTLSNARSAFLYPTATQIVDARTGKYSPQLESIFDEYIHVEHSSNVVEIDMGERSGCGGSDDDAKFCLYLLSPILKLNPNVQRFVVLWHYDGSMPFSKHIIYDRGSGIVSGSQNDLIGVNEKIFAMGVNDRTIHLAAQHDLPYQSLKTSDS